MKKGNGVDLPDWLDKEAWNEWTTYRKEVKKPLPPSTIKKQLKFLSDNKDNHIPIINQSITMGWTGLFLLKREVTPANKFAWMEEYPDD